MGGPGSDDSRSWHKIFSARIAPLCVVVPPSILPVIEPE